MSDFKFDKPIDNNESGILAKFWRKIVLENNYEPSLGLLVKRYIDTNDFLAGRIENHRKKTKSTIMSNICASGMTFKTFLDLVFNLLRAKKLDISIKLTMASGRESIHSLSITNDQVSKSVDDEKEVETKEVKEKKDGK